MSESSKSRPDEYDPITDYHHLKFQNRCLRGSGDDFQQLFEDIMVRARPGKFERVRPYGKFGDRKCDGLIQAEGTIFQVYSPDELKQSEVQNKIDEDLDGAVAHWGDSLKTWFFVYNVRRGVPNFFKKAKQVETGDKLIEKLKNAHPRLKDLVRSPLWITLLCRTWKRQPEELPLTKAELYQRFTKTFYDWKHKPYVPEEKRPLLERALGELAKNAIAQEDFRFRLRETVIRKELDKFDSSLFGIACALGWINKLGSTLENPDEPVYAFLHPTFQEYFAALALSKYSNPLVLTHHIFEPHWKEVILIALGIINNPIDFLRKLKGKIDEFLVGNDKLQDFLVWASNKSFSIIKLSPDIKYKPAAIRAFYLQFLSPRFVRLFLSTQLISKIDAQLAEDWNTNSSDYNSDPCKELVLDVYLMIALDYAYQRIEDVGRNIDNDYIAIYPDYYVKLSMNLSSDTKFKEKLEVLLVELESRHDGKSMLRLHQWWQINHNAWIQDFLELITEHRDIGWNWNFSRRELELLMDYIDANELLIDCADESSIELALREEIKEELLLPSITYIVNVLSEEIS